MNDNRYTSIAIGLHWLMAVMIFGLFFLGIYMSDLPVSPSRLKLYSWHKWAGVTVFVLVLARLAWRMGHRPPPLPHTMTRLQVKLAHGTHHLLYLLMVLIPLSGWLMSSALGFQTVWFGVLPLPDLLEKNKELGEVLKKVHMFFNLSMMGLVLGHAAVALKHHFKDRDGVLARMVPWL